MFRGSNSNKRSLPRPQKPNKQEWGVTGKNWEEKVNAKVEFKGESAKEH